MTGCDVNRRNLNKVFNEVDKVEYKKFVLSCCDRFESNLYGWEQPIISIAKVLKSNAGYNIGNIIEGKQAQNGYVIISAEKEGLSKAENEARTKQLEDWIVEAGYSFKHALGGYTYDGADGYTKEKSFVVFNYKRGGEKGNFEDLKDFAIKMCGEDYCDQQSVLIAAPGEVPVYVDRNGNEVSDRKHSSTKVSVNMKEPPAFTSFKTSRSRMNPETGKREKIDLPDRYETMDIAFNSFVRTLRNYGITHLGIVNTTANGNIRSSARGMVIVC